MKIELDTVLMNSYRLTPNYYVMLYFIHHGISHKLGPNTKTALQKLGFLDSNGNPTDKVEVLFKKEEIKELSDEDIKEFLVELREHFPKGTKTGGKPVRSAIGDVVIRKMKKFLKEYGYSKDIIRSATKAYVANRKKDGYKFMKTFSYFIDKQGEESTLASYCESIENGETENRETRITRTL